jgi:hypothetical protein
VHDPADRVECGDRGRPFNLLVSGQRLALLPQQAAEREPQLAPDRGRERLARKQALDYGHRVGLCEAVDRSPAELDRQPQAHIKLKLRDLHYIEEEARRGGIVATGYGDIRRSLGARDVLRRASCVEEMVREPCGQLGVRASLQDPSDPQMKPSPPRCRHILVDDLSRKLMAEPARAVALDEKSDGLRGREGAGDLDDVPARDVANQSLICRTVQHCRGLDDLRGALVQSRETLEHNVPECGGTERST